MTSKIGILLFICLILFAGAGIGAQLLLRHQGFQREFRQFAEVQVSEFLDANVQIGKVDVGFMNKISFSGLLIDEGDKHKNPFEFQIDSIEFKYNIFEMLAKSLEAPASILLKAPQLVLRDTDFPYDVLRDLNFDTNSKAFSSLSFEGGKVRYLLPRLDSEIVLTEMEGQFKPVGIGRIMVNIKANASGFITGKIHLKGEIDPIKKTHRLKADLKDVAFTDNMRLPLEHVEGLLRWEDGNLLFDEIKTTIHGWETKLQGSLRNLSDGMKPVLILDSKIGHKGLSAHVSLKADLANEEIKGGIKPLNQDAVLFDGKITQTNKRFDIKEMVLSTGYFGSGEIDFESGDYAVQFEKDRQRIDVRSNINELNFDLDLKLDHVEFYDLDVVTLVSIHISRTGDLSRSIGSEFEGSFRTEYFILEQAPFHEMSGSFLMNASGIRKIRSSWGGAFDLEGDIYFRSPEPDVRFSLKVDGYDLREFKRMLAKPMTKELEGFVDGKLRMEGSISKPEVFGDLIAKDGRLGKFDYDQTILHFRGFLPYLTLNDSRVLRGRIALQLKGALDFSLEKCYYGISLQSSDKIVLWKGWEVNAQEDSADLEIDHPLLGKLPALSLRAGLSSTHEVSESDGRQEDQYLVVGSKVKF